MNDIHSMEEVKMKTKRKFPWFAQQSWIHILFLHWPVTPEALKSFVPEELEIDTFNGSAWISIVAFHAEDSKLRLSPKWTALDPVTQINVRTYVKYPHSEEKGVYFFTIHVAHLTAALGAKSFFDLPFQYAQTTMEEHDDDTISISVKDGGTSLFAANYKPELTAPSQSELGKYLAERYCIWNKKGTNLIKIPIKHDPWELYDVDVKIQSNSLLPFQVGSVQPEAFYAPFKKTVLYPYETKLKTSEQ